MPGDRRCRRLANDAKGSNANPVCTCGRVPPSRARRADGAGRTARGRDRRGRRGGRDPADSACPAAGQALAVAADQRPAAALGAASHRRHFRRPGRGGTHRLARSQPPRRRADSERDRLRRDAAARQRRRTAASGEGDRVVRLEPRAEREREPRHERVAAAVGVLARAGHAAPPCTGRRAASSRRARPRSSRRGRGSGSRSPAW